MHKDTNTATQEPVTKSVLKFPTDAKMLDAFLDVIDPAPVTPAQASGLREALNKALTGLDAGCNQYASRTQFGDEVPGDEQYPWVRLMQIGRDAARAALAASDHDKDRTNG